MVTIEAVMWFLASWFVLSVVISIALGQLMRYNTAADDREAEEVAQRKQVVRYLRKKMSKTDPAVKPSEILESRNKRSAR